MWLVGDECGGPGLFSSLFASVAFSPPSPPPLPLPLPFPVNLARLALQQILDELGPLEAKISVFRGNIEASRLQHQNVSAIAEKGTPVAASLLGRLSSFRVLGILFVMNDFLGVLNELNRLFQTRLKTYKGIMEEVDETKRKLKRYFLGPNGVQNPSFKALLADLGGGGVGGEKALRARLQLHPGGFRAKYKNSGEDIRINQADFNEVVAAAKNLAQAAVHNLDDRFQAMPLMESFSVFDPHLFPLEEEDVQEYGNEEFQKLVNHYGQNRGTVEAVISAEKALLEWDSIKDTMYTVRKSHAINRKIEALEADEKKAREHELRFSQGSADEMKANEDEEAEVVPEVSPVGKADKKRKELSERFIKLFAEFWGQVKASRGGSRFPNVYKLVKIYVVQPFASIECERGFSAQNRIKNSARSTLTVPHLELLMRLSLSFRQGGIDLTAESSTPILVEAAKLFDKKKKRR